MQGSRGPLCELETQILLSGDLSYLDSEQIVILQRDLGEIERMLKSLIKSLEKK
ncbi:MAG: four helix bundle protein [Nitrospirota bacterium]